MLSRLLDSWTTFADAWYAKQFGAKERIQFYESLCALLENGVGIDDALLEVQGIFSDNGKKRRDPTALAAAGIGQAVRNGKSLGEASQRWIPYQETALIAAGERSNALVKAFVDCVQIIEARGRILSLILSVTIYPAMLWAMMAYLLHVISSRMVPAMARVSNPEGWTGIPYLLYQVSTYVSHWGLLTLILVVGSIVLSLVSLPFLTGPLRVRLDRLPPWSIYKALHGATFLLNVSVMLKANINQIEALRSLQQGANRWLRERLVAAIYGVNQGKNFGEALRLAGHEFPDKTAVQFLCVLATRKGFSEAIHRFSNRWIDQTLKQVERYTSAFLTFSTIAMGLLMLLVVSGVFSLQSNVASLHH